MSIYPYKQTHPYFEYNAPKCATTYLCLPTTNRQRYWSGIWERFFPCFPIGQQCRARVRSPHFLHVDRLWAHMLCAKTHPFSLVLVLLGSSLHQQSSVLSIECVGASDDHQTSPVLVLPSVVPARLPVSPCVPATPGSLPQLVPARPRSDIACDIRTSLTASVQSFVILDHDTNHRK